jgi:hypothetical protein
MFGRDSPTLHFQIASSTWTWNFVHLASPLMPYSMNNTYQNVVKRKWPMPQEADILTLWKDLISMVIVRHPFSRHTSGYIEKILTFRFHIMDEKKLENRAAEAGKNKTYEYPGDDPRNVR